MEQKNKEWWLKFSSIGLIVVSWLVFIGLKISNPDLKIGLPLTITIILSAIGIILFFGKKVLKIFEKKEDSLPKPMTEDEMMKIIKEEAIKRMANINVEKPYEWIRSKIVNKNLIYAYKINTDYEPFIIIINANYRDMKPSVLPITIDGKEIEKDDFYIDKEMSYKSQNPFEEPDREISEEGIDSFGKPIRKIERIIHKEKEKKEEDVI